MCCHRRTGSMDNSQLLRECFLLLILLLFNQINPTTAELTWNNNNADLHSSIHTAWTFCCPTGESYPMQVHGYHAPEKNLAASCTCNL